MSNDELKLHIAQAKQSRHGVLALQLVAALHTAKAAATATVEGIAHLISRPGRLAG